jgi:hypothetical protein
MTDAKDGVKRAYNDWGRNKPDAIGLSEQQKALAEANRTVDKVQADYNQWLTDLRILGISKNKVESVRKDQEVYFSIAPITITKEGVKKKP